MKIDFVGIRRAFSKAGAIGEVYVELPAEDAEPGVCAMMKKSMYGTRDAAQDWRQACTQFMCGTGFKSGQSSPCVFWNEESELRCVLHGDGLAVPRRKQA